MDAHPGVVFRQGPAGRRAVLIGGPDVWEVVRAIRSARTNGPALHGDDVLALVAEHTGVARRLLDVAVTYYSDYPTEVDALITEADAAEEAVADALGRRTSLLGT